MPERSFTILGESVRDRLTLYRERREQRRREEEERRAGRIAQYQSAVASLRATRDEVLATRPPVAEVLAKLRKEHPTPIGSSPVQPDPLPKLVMTAEQEEMLNEYAGAVGVAPEILLRALEDRQRLGSISAHFLGPRPQYPLPNMFPSVAQEPLAIVEQPADTDLMASAMEVPEAAEVNICDHKEEQ